MSRRCSKRGCNEPAQPNGFCTRHDHSEGLQQRSREHAQEAHRQLRNPNHQRLSRDEMGLAATASNLSYFSVQEGHTQQHHGHAQAAANVRDGIRSELGDTNPNRTLYRGYVRQLDPVHVTENISVFRVNDQNSARNRDIVVALRGTEFDFRGRTGVALGDNLGNNTFIAAGIGSNFDRVREAKAVLNTLMRQTAPGQQIIVTGHSAGGSLAYELAKDPRYARIKFIGQQVAGAFNESGELLNFTAINTGGDVVAGITTRGQCLEIPVDAGLLDAHSLDNHLPDDVMANLEEMLPDLEEAMRDIDWSSAVDAVDSLISIFGARRTTALRVGMAAARMLADPKNPNLASVPGIMGCISLAAAVCPELEPVVRTYNNLDLAKKVYDGIMINKLAGLDMVNLASTVANLIPGLDPKVKALISAVAAGMKLQSLLAAGIAASGPLAIAAAVLAFIAAMMSLFESCGDDDKDGGGGGDGEGEGQPQGQSQGGAGGGSSGGQDGGGQDGGEQEGENSESQAESENQSQSQSQSESQGESGDGQGQSQQQQQQSAEQAGQQSAEQAGQQSAEQGQDSAQDDDGQQPGSDEEEPGEGEDSISLYGEEGGGVEDVDSASEDSKEGEELTGYGGRGIWGDILRVCLRAFQNEEETARTQSDSSNQTQHCSQWHDRGRFNRSAEEFVTRVEELLAADTPRRRRSKKDRARHTSRRGEFINVHQQDRIHHQDPNCFTGAEHLSGINMRHEPRSFEESKTSPSAQERLDTTPRDDSSDDGDVSDDRYLCLDEHRSFSATAPAVPLRCNAKELMRKTNQHAHASKYGKKSTDDMGFDHKHAGARASHMGDVDDVVMGSSLERIAPTERLRLVSSSPAVKLCAHRDFVEKRMLVYDYCEQEKSTKEPMWALVTEVLFPNGPHGNTVFKTDTRRKFSDFIKSNISHLECKREVETTVRTYCCIVKNDLEIETRRVGDCSAYFGFCKHKEDEEYSETVEVGVQLVPLLDGCTQTLKTSYAVGDDGRASYKPVVEHLRCPVGGPCTAECVSLTITGDRRNVDTEEVNEAHAGDLFDGCDFFYAQGPSDDQGFSRWPADEIQTTSHPRMPAGIKAIRTYIKV